MQKKKNLKKLLLPGFKGSAIFRWSAILSILVILAVPAFLSGCVRLRSIFHATLPAEQTKMDDVNSKLLIIGVDSTYPPFEFIQEGEMKGFDVDLANEIAKKLGKEIMLEPTEWDTDFKMLREGSVDLIISAVPYNSEKDVIVDFSKPYFGMRYMLVELAGSEIKTKDELAGKRVGIMESGAGDIDPEYLADFEIVKYKDVLELLAGLKMKDTSAVLLSLPVGINLIKENLDTYNILDETISTQEFVIVFRKGSPLKGMIDTALDAIKSDGTYDTIYNKWFSLVQ